MDFEARPQTPAEWLDLLGPECFWPHATREELERQEVQHVVEIAWARRFKKEKEAARAALPALVAALVAMLILFLRQATATTISATDTAAPSDPQALGLGLPSLCLTPRLLAQRPIAARVRAGLLTT
jgi:hypothetical protein